MDGQADDEESRISVSVCGMETSRQETGSRKQEGTFKEVMYVVGLRSTHSLDHGQDSIYISIYIYLSIYLSIYMYSELPYHGVKSSIGKNKQTQTE